MSKRTMYAAATNDPDTMRLMMGTVYRNGKKIIEQQELDFPTKLARLKGKTIIGWKKAFHIRFTHLGVPQDRPVLIQLEIHGRTPRVQPANGKCRAARAKVLAICTYEQRRNGRYVLTGQVHNAVSSHDPDFIYKPGMVVRPKRVPGRQTLFTKDTKECAPGIHFFLTMEEAARYMA